MSTYDKPVSEKSDGEGLGDEEEEEHGPQSLCPDDGRWMIQQSLHLSRWKYDDGY